MPMHYAPMMDGGWSMGWMIFWWALAAVLAIAVVWALLARWGRRPDERSPEQVLKERYARGEIDRETYERMLEDLRR